MSYTIEKHKESFHRPLFIGPMTKNVVDAFLENGFNQKVGLIPSRRQIDSSPPGYVNNWTTSEFLEYTSAEGTVRCRDHAGPLQGLFEDDGYQSLESDLNGKFHFEIIHIDPWKKEKEIDSVADLTARIIDYCYHLNNRVLFEIGTEQGIRPYTIEEFEKFLTAVQKQIGPKFNNVIYGVIQGGTLLNDTHNAGLLNEEKCHQMINICKKFGLLSKEHNGDYLSEDAIMKRFALGLHAINIAPEFGNLETNTILEHINEEGFEKFFHLCLESKKWVKWLPKDFEVKSNQDKRKLIEVSGHYVISSNEFRSIKDRYHIDDEVIKSQHVSRIRTILNRMSQ